MKVFVIQEMGFNYNDETYDEAGVKKDLVGYKDENKAKDECRRLNDYKRATSPLECEDGCRDEYTDEGPFHEEYYRVAEIEIPDAEIQLVPEKLAGVVDAFVSAKRAIAEAKSEADKLTKGAFQEMLKSVFEANPDLKSFTFKAYTDYFNDGDPCTYNVYTDSLKVELTTKFTAADCQYKSESNTGDYEDGTEFDGKKFVQKREPSRYWVVQRAIKDVLANFNNDDYYEMFGDHVEVTIKKPGKSGRVRIEKEECSHD